MLRKTLAFCSLAVLGLPTALAGLLGQNINAGYDYLGTLYSGTVLVGAGVEISCPLGASPICGNALTASTQTIDIGDNTISYFYDGGDGPAAFTAAPGGFNGFEFSGLDAGGNSFSGLLLSSNIPGLDASLLSSTASSLRINMEGRSVVAGSYFTVTLVPEPASALMALSGLSLLVLLAPLRRRPR